MNLSRYISFYEEVTIVLSESDIDDILAIHSLPVSIESEHLVFDRALVKQFTLTLPKSDQPRALSLLLDFSTVIDTDSTKCEFSVCLRQLVAIGYFMPQLLRRNQMKFLDSVKIILERISHEYPTKKHFAHQYSAAIAFVLSPLAKRMTDVDISNPLYSTYQDIIELLLNLYTNDGFLTPKGMPRIVPFFFNSLDSFSSENQEPFTDTQNQILNNLLILLNKFIEKFQNIVVNFSYVVRTIFKIISNKQLLLEQRESLLTLLISILNTDHDVAEIVYNEENMEKMGKFVANTIKLIKLPVDEEKINQIFVHNFNKENILTGKYEKICHAIERTFEKDIPITPINQRTRTPNEKVHLVVPDLVGNNMKMSQFISQLMQLSYDESHTFRNEFHKYLIRGICSDQELNDFPIFTYFLITWVYKFMENSTAQIMKTFHEEKLYINLYKGAFFQLNDESLQDFILKVILLLTEKYHVDEPYFLSDLLIFVCDCLKMLNINQKILDCLIKCAIKTPSTFVNACKISQIAPNLSHILHELLALNISDKNEQLSSTRKTIILFIDKLDYLPIIFQYFFDNIEYVNAILTHFYDDSTLEFAATQMLLFFEQFTAKSDVFVSVIKFFSNFEMTKPTLLKLLDCCSHGFEANPYEIANLFDNTSILDILVESAVKLDCEVALSILLSIFQKMTDQRFQFSFKFDIFLKIEHLIDEQFDPSSLWQIVFNDDKGMTEPRKIKNSSPISLLFAISIKRKEIIKFIDFISECIKNDNYIMYDLASSELPARLIKFISEFRTKNCENEEFNKVLEFFLKISLASLKSSDLCSFFRLCTSLPGHKRPFFTLKIINMIKSVLDVRRKAPVTFFDLSGDKTHIQLPDIPIDLINKGFTFYLDIKFLRANFTGTIFEFSSNSCIISVSWENDTFSFLIKKGRQSMTHQWKVNMICNRFIPLAFNWLPKKLEFYAFNQKTIFPHKEIVYSEPFSHFQAMKNVPCQIYRIFVSKRFFTNQEVALLSQLPACPVTSFHSSEAYRFSKKFTRLFHPSIATDFHFLFNAAISSNFFAVNIVDDSTMRITGRIITTEPQPLLLLDTIGGISLLLPFFGQIEQPMIDGYKFDPEILPTLLLLLSSIFDNSLQHQRQFRTGEGPKILAFLLSLISLKNLQSEATINAFCKLFKSSMFIPLALQIMDSIVFNFKLWIYLPVETQLKIYKMFHDLIIDRVNQFKKSYQIGYNISKFLMLTRLYFWDNITNKKICLADEPKININDNIEEGRRPTDCSPIRSFFWDIIKNIQEVRYDDIDLLVSFCCDALDLDFAKEALTLFSYYLQQKNEVVTSYMNKENSFVSFFNMFKVPDPIVLYKVLQIYIGIEPAFLKPFTETEWDNGIILEIAAKSINLDFIKFLQKKMIKTRADHLSAYDTANLMIENPRFIPLYLMALQSLDENNMMKYFDLIDDLMRIDNYLLQGNWDYPFLLLIMAQMPSDYGEISQISQNCIELVTFLYTKSVRGKNPKSQFFGLQNFVQLMSYKSKKDFSYIIRRIYIEFLKKENPDDRPYTLIEIKTLIQLYLQIIEFLMIIPKFEETGNQTNYSFQELYRLMESGMTQDDALNYSYTTRSSDGEWKDKELVSLLIDSIMSRCIEITTLKDKTTGKNKDSLHPIELLGLLIQFGLGFTNCRDFIDFAEKSLNIFLTLEHIRTPVKKSILHIFFGLVKASENGLQKGNKENLESLFKISKSYSEYLQKEVKVTIPQTDKVDDFSVDVFSPINEAQTAAEVKISKLTRAEIVKKETAIFQLAYSLTNKVQLIKPLKPGEMSKEVFLRNNLEQFALMRKNESTRSMKKYKKLFRNLSSENGPWQTPEIEVNAHRRLDPRCYNFCRFFMKPNFKFSDHKDASLLRDMKNYNEAQDAYQKEFAKMKLLEFKGDLALVAADKQNLRGANTITDSVLLKCDARFVTMKVVYSGKIAVTQSAIFFDCAEKFVQIQLESITKVFLRRYLLLDSALEIFTASKKSYFFDFAAEQRNLLLDELSERNLSNIKFLQLKEDDILPLLNKATHNWQIGRITNFEYLLKLNKYAGRTYHDLSQYPVFPWIISDYSSDELDLTKPESFRDLSKPMGALTEDRLRELRARADSGFDELSSYMYGAFYSSAAVVIGYMIRMEPFTTLHVKLQNDRFDHGDRLFESLPRAWESASSTLMDYRELIPEFFYFPDFLVNENNLDLGIFTKTNEKINDVILPKWASSPIDFISKNREALETPFVTLSLPAWINLIFGPRSRMPLAKEHNNVFHPYYYETAAIGKTGKDLEIVREYAACFGSAPKQLFFDDPPQRSISPISFQNAFFGEEKTVVLSEKPIISLSPDSGNNIALTSDLDFHMGSQAKGHLQLRIPTELEDIAYEGQIAAVSSHSAVVALPWDYAVYVFNFEGVNVEPMFISRIHNKKISALAMSENYIASGSKDCTIRIWDNRKMKNLHFIAKHRAMISAIELNQKLRICAAASTDGYVSVNSLVSGESLCGTYVDLESPSIISISNFGSIVVVQNGPTSGCKTVVLDQNLKQICRKKFSSSWRVAKVISWNDGCEYIAAAMNDKKIRFFKLPFLTPLNSMIETNYNVRCLAFHRDQMRMLVGDENGCVHCHRFIQ
ncbi:hypothetical protein TRFO_12118 [Tritrichomonas foetus]|uniref:Beige/BEACH domain containing protein n=1 Tax=Tritrichomonas foetus TaxID=1144522 RepID=A0A1J4IZW2_9EUKA|nr:hypothetical protein TRFO_12118 [Tritrichomonas foetus]|eukprot:OHS92942.1 hypothetical protein TRFO_12118 [Tritrichomonas foetus]